MPAGPAGMGFVYFVAVKLAGYTAFCHWAIRPQLSPAAPPRTSLLGDLPALQEQPNAPDSWVAGAIRTALGVAIGAVVGTLFWKVPLFIALGDKTGDAGTLLFFLFLIPVRVFEWWLLLHTVYRNHPTSRRTEATLIGGGILASFILDAIGVLTAFVLPGGMWVC